MKHIAELIKKEPNTAVFPPNPIESRKKIERFTLDQLDETVHPLVKTACNAARKWSNLKRNGHDGASLILVASSSGETTGYGCGKTHIARSVLWSIYRTLDDGTPISPVGRFFEAREIIIRLKDEKIESLIPPPVDTPYGRIEGCPIVVLDDVGTEGDLSYVAKEDRERVLHARYFEIINYCYSRQISVVITANLTLQQLRDHIGGRSWSRILQMAPKGLIVDMTGVPDMRPKIGGR